MTNMLGKRSYSSRLLTHPGPVKILHDLEVGHLAVLCTGQSHKEEGYDVPQHCTSEKKKKSQVRYCKELYMASK